MNFRKIKSFFAYIFKGVDNIRVYTGLCMALIAGLFFRKKDKESSSPEKKQKQIHIIDIINNTYDKYKKNDNVELIISGDNLEELTDVDEYNSEYDSEDIETQKNKKDKKGPEDAKDPEYPEMVIIELTDLE